MSTTSKVAFREQSKGMVCEVWIESDELSKEEVLAQSKELYAEAKKFSTLATMGKI